jgi:hypothetical protein
VSVTCRKPFEEREGAAIEKRIGQVKNEGGIARKSAAGPRVEARYTPPAPPRWCSPRITFPRFLLPAAAQWPNLPRCLLLQRHHPEQTAAHASPPLLGRRAAYRLGEDYHYADLSVRPAFSVRARQIGKTFALKAVPWKPESAVATRSRTFQREFRSAPLPNAGSRQQPQRCQRGGPKNIGICRGWYHRQIGC